MNREARKAGRLLLMAGKAAGPRDTVLEEMLASLPRSPGVAYVGAANGDSPAFFARMRGLLLASGAGRVEGIVFKARTEPDKVLRDADLVYISGGDVEEGMRVLRESGGGRVLRKLFDGGMPFMGLSAGTILLGRAWVRWRDPEDDGTAELFPCLGFCPFILDTHDEDSGWEELRRALALAPPGTTGYGIPSGGGLVVEPDGTVTPLGAEPLFKH